VIGVLGSAMVLTLLLPVLRTCPYTDLWPSTGRFRAHLPPRMAIAACCWCSRCSATTGRIGVVGVAIVLSARQCTGVYRCLANLLAGGGGLITAAHPGHADQWTFAALVRTGPFLGLWGTWPLLWTGPATSPKPPQPLDLRHPGIGLDSCGLLLSCRVEWPLPQLPLLSLVVWNTACSATCWVSRWSRPADSRPNDHGSWLLVPDHSPVPLTAILLVNQRSLVTQNPVLSGVSGDRPSVYALALGAAECAPLTKPWWAPCSPPLYASSALRPRWSFRSNCSRGRAGTRAARAAERWLQAGLLLRLEVISPAKSPAASPNQREAPY